MTAEATENPLPARYWRWLYDQVVDSYDVEGLSSYTLVCDRMHNTRFKALVPHDDNRITDGTNLRREFLDSCGGHILDRNDVLFPDATVLEVLVSLAKRANLMVELTVQKWFQIFLKNLGLDRYCDWYCMSKPTWRIDRTIQKFNNRDYDPRGKGGLFPLQRALQDQRRVELWYQMGAFMTEHSMY